MMQLEPVDFLRELVSIPSLSGQEAAVAHFLVGQMQRLGLQARVDAVGNAVGIRECPEANGRIRYEVILLGHMDTVPGDIPVRIEAGRLYGRGSVDAKGPLAAFVIAAAQAPLVPGTRVVVIGAVEEESATSKGARYAAGQYQPDACIIGEPSGWDALTIGYKGRILFEYELRQPMRHSAGPETGVAETAVAWWQALADYARGYNDDKKRLFDQIIPSLRHIQTGSNGLTEQAFARVGVRLPPGFDAEAFAARVSAWAGEAVVSPYGYEPAYQSTRTHPLARAFNHAFRQREIRTRYKLKTGTSDMNIVGPVWRCPIAAYGPGDSGLDHTPAEHLIIEEYLQAIEILKNVLGKLCHEHQ